MQRRPCRNDADELVNLADHIHREPLALVAMLSDRRTSWRFFAATLLVVLVGLPVVLPFLHLVNQPRAWEGWRETLRLLQLTWNTVRLVAGTVLLALPSGTALAVLLYRTNMPGEAGSPASYSPLAVHPSSAHCFCVASGTRCRRLVAAWNLEERRLGRSGRGADGVGLEAVAHGLPAAIWIHATAGLPWVVWIVGYGLRSVEREAEEDGLTIMRPLRVLWHVTLPRCRAVIWAAALWLALQVATEITVTDVAQVNTFAEEVYTQIVVGDDLSVLRSVAVATPSVILLGILVGITVRTIERRIPPLESLSGGPVHFPLRSPAWVAGAILAVAIVGVLALVPFASLVWKLGMHGAPESWSAEVAWTHLDRAIHLRGEMAASRLMWAFGTGFLTACIGLVASWLVVGSRWFGVLIIGLVAMTWAVPAPIIGLGLKEMIDRLLALFPFRGLAKLLYYGPSFLPVVWAHLIDFSRSPSLSSGPRCAGSPSN